jgi:hypothetical protein
MYALSKKMPALPELLRWIALILQLIPSMGPLLISSQTKLFFTAS